MILLFLKCVVWVLKQKVINSSPNLGQVKVVQEKKVNSCELHQHSTVMETEIHDSVGCTTFK